ncbi:MAG TPA: substrate-binding domain-containing protein [Rhizomicrobium sp.]
MLKLQHYLLASACLAVVGAASFALPAQAASNCSGMTNCDGGPYTFGKKDTFGAGSSLVAPYWRQTDDCFANPAALINKGTPPTFVDESFFNYKGAKAQNCATQHVKTGETVWYISTGSGTGILGVFSHDSTQYGFVDGGQTQYFNAPQYGLSDAGLGSSDVTAYDNGGQYTQGSVTLNIGAPNQVACTSGSTNPYPNPAQCYGPLVQFPFSIDPVAQSYQNTYEKVLTNKGQVISYNFNIKYGRKDSSGGLRLSQTTLCKIWNAQITNWNDPAITADNGGQSLQDPQDPSTSWSVPLIPVGRSDSSGTTSIITRHLAAICPSLITGNLYTTGATTLQNAGAGSIVGSTYDTTTSNFPGVDQTGKITIAPGSSGVAQYTAFTAVPTGSNSNCTVPAGDQGCIAQGRIAYIGPDYVLPYVNKTLAVPYGLDSATLQNSGGKWIEPTPKGASSAFGSIQPPQSDSKGNYCPSCTDWGMRNDPTAWVQGLSPSSPLANPLGNADYPMVGTTNYLGYTCIANKNVEATLVGDLGYVNSSAINTDTKAGILASAGLSPLPKQWLTAVSSTFIGNKSGLGLNITTAGKGTMCSAAGVIGG